MGIWHLWLRRIIVHLLRVDDTIQCPRRVPGPICGTRDACQCRGLLVGYRRDWCRPRIVQSDRWRNLLDPRFTHWLCPGFGRALSTTGWCGHGYHAHDSGPRIALSHHHFVLSECCGVHRLAETTTNATTSTITNDDPEHYHHHPHGHYVTQHDVCRGRCGDDNNNIDDDDDDAREEQRQPHIGSEPFSCRVHTDRRQCDTESQQ